MSAALQNLGGVNSGQENYAEAERYFESALGVEERLGRKPRQADLSARLAWVKARQGKYADAEALYQEALVVSQEALGPDHAGTESIRNGYAHLLRKTGRSEEASLLVGG